MVFIYTLQSLKETFEARASEWMLAAATVSLAIVLFYNPTMFADRPAGFSGLSSLASQPIWGWGLLIVGGMRLVVLFINGGWWRTPHFRAGLAFLTCFAWFYLSVGFARNLSLGIAFFPWVFLLDAYNSVRVIREAGVAQYLHKHYKGVREDAPTAKH